MLLVMQLIAGVGGLVFVPTYLFRELSSHQSSYGAVIFLGTVFCMLCLVFVITRQWNRDINDNKV